MAKPLSLWGKAEIALGDFLYGLTTADRLAATINKVKEIANNEGIDKDTVDAEIKAHTLKSAKTKTAPAEKKTKGVKTKAEPIINKPKATKLKGRKAKTVESPAPVIETPQPAPVVEKKVGRPRKHSSGGQVSIWLTDETKKALKIKAIENDITFADLVAKILEEGLKNY